MAEPLTRDEIYITMDGSLRGVMEILRNYHRILAAARKQVQTASNEKAVAEAATDALQKLQSLRFTVNREYEAFAECLAAFREITVQTAPGKLALIRNTREVVPK